MFILASGRSATVRHDNIPTSSRTQLCLAFVGRLLPRGTNTYPFVAEIRQVGLFLGENITHYSYTYKMYIYIVQYAQRWGFSSCEYDTLLPLLMWTCSIHVVLSPTYPSFIGGCSVHASGTILRTFVATFRTLSVGLVSSFQRVLCTGFNGVGT